MPRSRSTVVSVPEPTRGQPITFTISHSGDFSGPTFVQWRTVTGTAAAGSDFVVVPTTANFAAGEATTSVAVTVNGDTTPQGDETFSRRSIQPAPRSATVRPPPSS